MSISLSTDLNATMSRLNAQNAKSGKAEALSSKLNNLDSASDEELMEVCKSFEAYLAEQVINKVKEAVVPKDEDDKENDYVAMFGDMLYQKYAEQLSASGELGLAQQLYEAMKRDIGGTTIE